MTNTYISTSSVVKKKWYLIDARDQTLGRLAGKISVILMGKNRSTYSPHQNNGDSIIVINAEKIYVSGKKENQKMYRFHSGRPGGMKTESFKSLLARKPERIIENAVKGMLPKNRIGRQMLTNLKVYKGTLHPHDAQMPEVI
uniref:Large ribosomal subunit protein uL13c n=1 Tax=Rhizochromulina marina TaxID=1034831 RepID=A0A514CPT9_9STRA|nr:ribosomal protein L13 [Rhizochromulina marina]QDH81820.1 ribosomal protein L13 [Rhizochromulina marina]